MTGAPIFFLVAGLISHLAFRGQHYWKIKVALLITIFTLVNVIGGT